MYAISLGLDKHDFLHSFEVLYYIHLHLYMYIHL